MSQSDANNISSCKNFRSKIFFITFNVKVMRKIIDSFIIFLLGKHSKYNKKQCFFYEYFQNVGTKRGPKSQHDPNSAILSQ